MLSQVGLGVLRRGAGGVLVALAISAGCRGKAPERSLAGSAAVRANTPPARPPAVFAELVVPRPAQLWADAKPLFGASAALLPKSPELALGVLLGLPALAATGLDANAPLLAAWTLDGASGAMSGALGARVASGRELVASLTTGNAPTHRLETRGDLTLLRASSEPPSTTVLAVLDDTVLVGEEPTVLALGPYLVRGLGGRPIPPSPLVLSSSGDALARLVVPVLQRAWKLRLDALAHGLEATRKERGRAADYADPEAALLAASKSVASFLEVLESAREVRVELQPRKDRVVVDARLVPEDQGAAESLATGLSEQASLEGLARLQNHAHFGFLWARSAPEKTGEWSKILKPLLGERATDAELRVVDEALVALDEGCGAVHTWGASAGGEWVWTGEVADRVKLEQGIERAIALVRQKPFVALLASRGQPRVRTGTRPSSVGAPVHFAEIGLIPAPAERAQGRGAQTIELLWTVSDGAFTMVAAEDADPLFARLTRASSASSMQNSSPLALLAPNDRAAFAAFVDAGALGLLGPARESALLAFALSGGGQGVHLRVAAAPRAAQLLMQRMIP